MTTDPSSIRRDLEALLFAAGRPVTVEEILKAMALSSGEARDLVNQALEDLQAEFPPGGPRGFELVNVAGGWVFRTNPKARAVVETLFAIPDESARLSPAAMECLAIVAYLQPVSRAQISEIRGVDSDSTVRTLLERDLITEVGRAHGGGGAVLYGTTARFEAMFGLSSLDDLPPLDGFALTEEEKEHIRTRLGILTLPE